MTTHFVVNTFRGDAVQAAVDAAAWMHSKGFEVRAEPESARAANLESVGRETFGACDLVIAFGGDGTLLRAAHLIDGRETPILGVYYGRFGFVTQCTGEDLRQCVERFIAGDTRLESRMMVQSEILRGQRTIATLHAMNEAILQRSVNVRMLSFHVTLDGHFITSYPADGIIVSTPTGSTAYNLSVGGPIIDPNVQALILSALAPHTLSARTLVLRHDSEIRLHFESDGDAVLSADGQTRLHVLSGDIVRITKSPRVTNLVSVEKDDFLIKLGRRLFWSHSILGSDE